MLSTTLLLAVAFVSLLSTVTTRPQPAFPHQHPSQSYIAYDSLLETGSAANVKQPALNSAEWRVVSYNIRWRGGADLRELITLFRNDPEIGNAAVLALQEVDRRKKRTGNENTVKTMAEALGMHYAWTAPPATKTEKEEETGVAILSVFPLHDIQRIVLPNLGPGGRRRVALGATIMMGQTSVRIYSVHSETRISISRKLEQMKAIIGDLARYPNEMPAVIMGDLNTWEPAAVKKTQRLFDGSGFNTPFNNQSTFYRRLFFFPLKLKLDWVWLRHVQAVECGIDREIDLSDHWPLWTRIRLPNAKP